MKDFVMRGLLAALLALVLSAPLRAAEDARLCSAADQPTCTGSNLRVNADEELAALSRRAPMTVAVTQSGNDLSGCPVPAITTYADGMRVRVKLTAAITGAATLNLCSVGAVAVTSLSGVATASGDMTPTALYDLSYFAANNQWRAMSPLGLGVALPANSVSNGALAQMPGFTFKCNANGAVANATDCSTAVAKSTLGITTGDVLGLGTLASQSSVTAAQMPALTGDVTAAAGTTATTLALGVVANNKMAVMPATSIKGNNSGGAAIPADLTPAQVSGMINSTVAPVFANVTAKPTTLAGYGISAIGNSDLGNMPATTLKGNATAGAAAPTDLTPAQVSGMINATVAPVFANVTAKPTTLAGYGISAIGNSDLGNMPATTLKGNATAGAAAPTDLTPAQVSGMINATVAPVFANVTAKPTTLAGYGIPAIALGSQTTGNYVAGASAGVGLAVTGTAAAGWSPSYELDFTAPGVDPALLAGQGKFQPNGLVFEGATANTFESFVNITDPTADRTLTIPDASTVTVQALTCGGTDKVSAINATTGAVTCSADVGGGGGGTAITTNTVASTAVNLNDTTPVAASPGTNVKWQRSAGSPDQVSAYLPGAIIAPTGEITTPSTATVPAAPAATQITRFGWNFAGMVDEAVRVPGRSAELLQDQLGRNPIGFWQPPGNGTTVPGVLGFNAPIAQGTATTRSVTTTSMANRARRLGYVSAATAAAMAGHYNGSVQFTSGTGTSGVGGFLLVARFVPSNAAAVAGERTFVGMRNATAAPTNVEPNTLTNVVGLCQLSTSNNFQICYGGSAASTAIDLGVNFPATGLSTDLYEFTLFSPSETANQFTYRVERLNTGNVAEGTLTGTAGTAFPLNTTTLGFAAWKTNNATLLAVGIDVASVYIEQEN
jgi:hypothetical protein